MENKTVYSCTTTGRYKVVLWSTEYDLDNNFWWVHDTLKHTFKKIGRVGAKRTNYYDKAIEYCNEKEGKNV